MAALEKVLRISQLDSLEMDNELISAMQENMQSIFRQLPNPSLFERLRPELKCILKFFLLKWSLGSNKNGATFGQQIMSLKYVQQDGSELTQRHKWLLILLYLAPVWLTDRYEDILNVIFPHRHHSLPSSRIINFIKVIANICGLLNFCSFILYGRYPSIKERFLSLKTISLRPQILRELSFLYMNREIIWYGFSEFLFTVLPLINFRSLQNYLQKFLYGVIKREKIREDTFNDNICVFCNHEPVIPQIANCGHMFCYYCVAANVMADSGYPCPDCNINVAPFYHYCKKIN